MDSENVVCPVCTLYLRPGITLKSHLTSHPKQKVIEALVRLSYSDSPQKTDNGTEIQTDNKNSHCGSSSSGNQTWNQSNSLSVNTVPQTFGGVQGNHSFIYQQFMSTSSPQSNVLNVNPLTQQYVTIPAVFSPQMMCPPYVYQQQQVIMSSGPSMQPLISRSLPIELPAASINSASNSQQNAVVAISEADDTADLQNESVSIKEKVGISLSQHSEKELDSKNDSNNYQEDEVQIVESEKGEESETEMEPTKKIDAEDVSALSTEIEIKECNENDTGENLLEKGTDEEIGDGKNCAEFVEQDECFGSPRSNEGSDWSVRVRTDLSKACQTQSNSNNFSPPPSPHQDLEGMDTLYVQNESSQQEQEFYYTVETDRAASITSANNTFERNEPIYTTSTTVIPSTEQINFVEMEGMQLMLSNDFISGQLISQVEDFDCINNPPERPGVLMTIGGIESSREVFNEYREDERLDESVSRESTIVNIRADERMPARGELSGQESNGGASDIAWSRVQYHEGSSEMSTTYELIARENWEVSDCSDSEVSPLQSRVPPHTFSPDINDTPTVVDFTQPPLNFKCSICNEGFTCLQERQQHVKEQHTENKENNLNIVGSELGKKKVKKLVVKPKKEVKTENNFDNVFTNKLKLETATEGESVQIGSILQQPTIEVIDADKSRVEVKIVCSICDAVLSSRKALQEHKLQIHNVSTEVRHKCATCNEAFPNEYKYTEHLRVHPLECRLCGKYFYRRQNMQLHMKRHLGIRPYKCDICEKSFLTKQKHDEHKNVHTGDAPIKCSLCEETFRRHSNLVQHRNLHHFNIKKKVKDFICYCGEIFHSKKKLAWHKEVHDAKPKSCTHCSEKFIHMASLTRHMRRAHNDRFVPKEERSTENVECPICKGVYLRSSLEVHIRNHSGQRPYTCLICNKDFTTKWNLKLHKWTHAARTSKPFRCDQCKGAFIRETDYIAHMNSHKSVRPYTCNYCGAQFIRKYNCQRHVREHEKGKSFSCQICGKSFHRSYYLKDHMRVHSGLRPYSCHICGKTSTTKSNHNKHVRIHHAREPVSTEN